MQRFPGAPFNPVNPYAPKYDLADDKNQKALDPVLKAVNWFKAQPRQIRLGAAIAAGLLTLLILFLAIENHDTFFILAESAHFIGLGFLGYTFVTKRNCGGISLRSQELTAAFLTIRLYCSLMMEFDLHTLLDLLTLMATLWIIYQMHGPLKHTYKAKDDSMHWYKICIPAAIMAIFAHPRTSHIFIHRWLWACCVYMEAVSVLPQLIMFRNARVVERFAGHYLFALGIARYLACAHWILQLLDKNGQLIKALGSGLWPIMVLLAEVVQTFVLAEFTYLYVKSYADGSGVLRIPV